MECNISFITKQSMEGELIEEKMQCAGKYTYRSGVYYVTFSDEEETKTQRLMKFDEAVFSYTVSGQYSTKTEFVPGKETRCLISTPFGELNMKVKTYGYEMTKVDNSIHISVIYDMFSQGTDDAVKTEITLKIELSGDSNGIRD